MFPYPKLVTKRDISGKTVYEITFDNSKSYYQHLLEGDNPVLTTNLVSDPAYPQFVQRNLYFNPMVNTTTSKAKAAPTSKKKTTKPVESKEPVQDGNALLGFEDNTQPDLTAFNSLADIDLNQPLSGSDEEILAQIQAAERAAIMGGSITPMSAEVVKMESSNTPAILNPPVENKSDLKSTGKFINEYGFSDSKEVAIFEVLEDNIGNTYIVPNPTTKIMYYPSVDMFKSHFNLKGIGTPSINARVTPTKVRLNENTGLSILEKGIIFISEKNIFSSEVTTSGSITSLDDIPNEDIEQQYADKIYSPLELLEYKLKTGEIKQDCK